MIATLATLIALISSVPRPDIPSACLHFTAYATQALFISTERFRRMGGFWYLLHNPFHFFLEAI